MKVVETWSWKILKSSPGHLSPPSSLSLPLQSRASHSMLTHPLPFGIHAVSRDVGSVGQPSGSQRRGPPGDLNRGGCGPSLDDDILWWGRGAWKERRDRCSQSMVLGSFFTCSVTPGNGAIHMIDKEERRGKQRRES